MTNILKLSINKYTNDQVIELFGFSKSSILKIKDIFIKENKIDISLENFLLFLHFCKTYSTLTEISSTIDPELSERTLKRRIDKILIVFNSLFKERNDSFTFYNLKQRLNKEPLHFENDKIVYMIADSKIFSIKASPNDDDDDDGLEYLDTSTSKYFNKMTIIFDFDGNPLWTSDILPINQHDSIIFKKLEELMETLSIDKRKKYGEDEPIEMLLNNNNNSFNQFENYNNIFITPTTTTTATNNNDQQENENKRNEKINSKCLVLDKFNSILNSFKIITNQFRGLDLKIHPEIIKALLFCISVDLIYSSNEDIQIENENEDNTVTTTTTDKDKEKDKDRDKDKDKEKKKKKRKSESKDGIALENEEKEKKKKKKKSDDSNSNNKIDNDKKRKEKKKKELPLPSTTTTTSTSTSTTSTFSNNNNNNNNSINQQFSPKAINFINSPTFSDSDSEDPEIKEIRKAISLTDRNRLMYSNNSNNNSNINNINSNNSSNNNNSKNEIKKKKKKISSLNDKDKNKNQNQNDKDKDKERVQILNNQNNQNHQNNNITQVEDKNEKQQQQQQDHNNQNKEKNQNQLLESQIIDKISNSLLNSDEFMEALEKKLISRIKNNNNNNSSPSPSFSNSNNNSLLDLLSQKLFQNK